MVGRTGENHFFITPGDSGEVAGGLGVADEAEVGFIGQHGLTNAVGTKILDFQLGVREAAVKLPLQLGHFAESDGVDGGDADGAGNVGFDAGERSVKFVLVSEGVFAKAGEDLTRGGEGQGAAGAVYQRCAQFPFDFL